MDDDTRAAVKDALVREVIGLGALFAILWVLGPGRTLVPALVARAKSAMGVGADPFEGQARQFASEVSRWDHEQASTADRKAAPGGCGCG